MKLYFAGSFSGVPTTKLKSYGVKNKLYSFVNENKAILDWGSKGLMLDSGAFTEFTTGKPVDINKLVQFIKTHKPEYAIQLDVIGNDTATWKNYQYMKAQGLNNILPVIHYRASEAHIERVVASSDYVLLGGLVPLTRQATKLQSWLDYLYSKYKLQDKKIHALGVTTEWALKRYPFYSVDSSSALSITRYPSSNKMRQVKQKTLHYTDLYEVGIKPMLELEQRITKLWESRGVKWD